MKEDTKKDNSKAANYAQVGKGQYQLHVLIQSTSALSLTSDEAINAKIAVTAFGKTQYTKVKSNIGVEETFWGEHFYFNQTFENSGEAQNQRLLIAVYDYNKILANSLVGNYEIDIQRIYSQQGHTLRHTWLALSNVQKKFTEITGYVKISASLLGESDMSTELEVEPISSITKQKKVLVPPQIERKTYQIIVDVLEGKNIKPADGTTVDSYVGVQFGQVYSVSETIAKNCNPIYETRVYLPMSLPAVIQNIAFRLNDFNFIQKVEVLGSYYLNINALIKAYESIESITILEGDKKKKNQPATSLLFENRIPYNEFQWVNFYGPQVYTNRDEQKNLQEFFPALAPYYVGSVLMRVQIKENSQPEIKKEKVPSDEIKVLKLDKIPPVFYKVTAKITAAINIFDKNKKYRVSVKVGADEMETEMAQAKNGFCFWNIQKSMTITVSPIQTIPDIFIYLVDEKNQKICFKRCQPKQKQVLEDSWVKLTPDLAVVNLQNEQAGYMKVGVEMLPTNRKQNPVSRKMNSPLYGAYNANRKSGRLIIDLFCAESLTPLDDDGGVDAFFSFGFLLAEAVSSVKDDSLNPVYYERLIIETDIMDEQGCPPIIVNAYDKDQMSNDFMGSTYIDVGQAIKNKSLVYGASKNPQPFWYTLTQNDMPAGKFLATFRMLPNYNKSIPRDIILPKKQFQIMLVILGLRGLKNSSIISVKQPYIQFDFAGLDVFNATTSKEVRESKTIRTQPKQKGRSVNINTVVPAKLMLPQNYKYWPSLSCKVKDNVLGSFYQPVLGYFSINLQQAFERSEQTKKQFQQERAMLMQNKNPIESKPPKLANINDNLILSIRNFILKSLNYNWKVLQPGLDDKLNNLIKHPNTKLNEDYIVVFPYYEKEVMEKKIKDKTKKKPQDLQKIKYIQKHKDIINKNGNYMQVGFDDVKTRGLGTAKRNKHYRYVLSEPYEDYYQKAFNHKLGIMEQIPIRVGKVIKGNDLITSVIRKFTKEDSMAGFYKGQLFINQFNEKNYEEEEQFKKTTENLLNLMMRKQKIHMYLYIIEAANLPPKDAFSNSDPFIKVKAGKQEISFQKQFFQDEPNPQFFKKIHMVLQFPEDATIDIQVWDYDPVGANQIIGAASIDVQDRIQAKISDARFNNPIQTHNLTHESSKRAQGLIRFWVDLVPVQKISLYRQFEISNISASTFELRVIVWSCSGMPNNDIQDMSDLYIEGMFNDVTESTDVHYRTSTGDGYFNWRMVFPIKMPAKNPMLTFKVFDKDIVTSNDYLASTSFSIQHYLQQAYETGSSVVLYLGQQDLAKYSEVPGGKSHIINGREMFDRFEIDTVNREGDDPTQVNQQGKIQLSVEILSQEDAKKNPAGKGRDNPNQHPMLPEPKGRMAFSLNPLKMISQICGPKFRGKILVALCIVLCIVFLIYFGVAFGGSLVGSLVAKVA